MFSFFNKLLQIRTCVSKVLLLMSFFPQVILFFIVSEKKYDSLEIYFTLSRNNFISYDLTIQDTMSGFMYL